MASSGTESQALRLFDLPAMDSIEDLSSRIHVSAGLIYRLLKWPREQYKTYRLPKSSGGSRLIAEPSAELKAIQAWILRSILDRLTVSAASKGFQKGSGICHNAAPHVGAKTILSVDIEDFFPSIRAGRVFKVFRTVGYSVKGSAMLTSLCTLNGSLPQGAPTSPKLANLVCWQLDRRLLGFVGRRGITYTRYADDLTFSAYSYTKLVHALTVIRQIVNSEGLRLNESKTRISGPSRRHRVTGLIVNEKSYGVGRETYRVLRSKLHRLSRTPSSAPDGGGDVSHARGWLAFVKDVDPVREHRLRRYVDQLRANSPGSLLHSLCERQSAS